MRRGLRERLVRALADLPDRQREPIALAYFGHLTYEEVAAVLGRAARHGQEPHPHRAAQPLRHDRIGVARAPPAPTAERPVASTLVGDGRRFPRALALPRVRPSGRAPQGPARRRLRGARHLHGGRGGGRAPHPLAGPALRRRPHAHRRPRTRHGPRRHPARLARLGPPAPHLRALPARDPRRPRQRRAARRRGGLRARRGRSAASATRPRCSAAPMLVVAIARPRRQPGRVRAPARGRVGVAQRRGRLPRGAGRHRRLGRRHRRRHRAPAHRLDVGRPARRRRHRAVDPPADLAARRAGAAHPGRGGARRASTWTRSRPTSASWPGSSTCTTCTCGRSPRTWRRPRPTSWCAPAPTATPSSTRPGRCSSSATASRHATLQVEPDDHEGCTEIGW